MKALGQLHHFLGIEVTCNTAGLFLSQTKYATDLLSGTSMIDCKPYASPSNYKGSSHGAFHSTTVDSHLYRSITGALQYLTLARPNLFYAVNQAYQHITNPTFVDFTALKQIMCYIKGTLLNGIHFKPGPLKLIAYADANWAGNLANRRSNSGYCVLFGSSLVSWCSKKQPTVARSSTEAEYRALAHTAAELSWLRMLLRDLHIFLPYCPHIWCDNM